VAQQFGKIEKFSSSKHQGSLMPMVRAEYNGFVEARRGAQ